MQSTVPVTQTPSRKRSCAALLAERDQLVHSLCDLGKVILLLILALAFRTYWTSRLRSPIEGTQDISMPATPGTPALPHPLDLSTAEF